MEESLTVAVVDPNPGARHGLVRLLGQTPGIRVVGKAGDPGEALKLVTDQRPDVVLVDVRRIDPTGVGFLGRMAAAAPEAGIVVLTAYLTEKERSDLFGAGARAILLKEIDAGTLVRTVRTTGVLRAPGERRRTLA